MEFLQLVSRAVKSMTNTFGTNNNNKKKKNHHRTEEAKESAIIELHGAVLVFNTFTNAFAEKLVRHPEQMQQVHRLLLSNL